MGTKPGVNPNESLAERVSLLRPKNALSAYFELSGRAGLFPQFAAVVARQRPGMDCWIPSKNIEKFKRFAEGQGLSLRMDCAFRRLPSDASGRIVGFNNLCTTYAEGVRVQDAQSEDEVHVFVGLTPKIAEEMCACGWYPVVVKDRFFNKPVIDHIEFGKLLGYPRCCIDFFSTSNNWHRTNSCAEAYLKTTGQFDYRTNCFGKNLGYSLNFHLPCRFDCAKTIEFSTRVADYLTKVEPEYFALCFELLRKPVLSLNERENVLLDGERIGENLVKYTSALNLFATPDPVLKAIGQGNVIEIRGRFVAVLHNSDVIDVFECRCDEFGPRVPLLFFWS